MKRILFVACAVCWLAATAQEEQATTLGEVTVKGARTVQKVDGQWIYPSRQQLDSSPNAYSLLAKLALPHIRVDEAMSSITALTSLGTVQVRINDAVATREDLQALEMQGIDHIEFIDNPGVRYGEGIAYIIDIKVSKPVSGYAIGSQLTNTLTAKNGSETVFGRLNRGRSEFGLSYSLNYYGFSGEAYDEKAAYQLESGDIISMHRRSLSKESRNLSHNAQLAYSLSDSSYVFQARLSGSRNIRPQRTDALMALDNQPYEEHSASRSGIPSLDLYYHQDLARHQSLTANVVETYIGSDGRVENTEQSDYRYTTSGKTYTHWSEAIYDNRLKPFTVSLGMQYAQRYSHNEYHGDAEAVNELRTSSLYLFSQLKGTAGRLGYMAGLGVSRRYYRQEASEHDFWLFRPKLTVSYRLADRLKLKYDFELSQHVSQIALVSDVSIRQNSMETILGNPDIRPNSVIAHLLQLSYASPRFTSELRGYYRLNPHCNMEKYIRQDDHFYKTQTNADNRCNFFYIDTYNQWDIIPEHLSATVYGGLYRFFNYGDGYTHTYTSFNGGCSVNAYLNRWTLGAYADNGWNFMEGEHRGHQSPAWYLTLSYRTNRHLTVSLYAQHLLSQHPRTNTTEIISRYVTKEIVQHCRDYGNMLTLSLSYRFDHGRKYRDIERTMNHTDSDAGILAK